MVRSRRMRHLSPSFHAAYRPCRGAAIRGEPVLPLPLDTTGPTACQVELLGIFPFGKRL